MSEDFDRWDQFWSDYMVWLLRLVCYFSNFLFLEPIQVLVVGGLHSELPFEVGVLVYSVVLLGVIEKTIARRFNPQYEHLSLTAEELKYRVGGERLLLSCFSYSAFNFVLGMMVGIGSGGRSIDSAATGFAAIVGSIFAVFFGIVFLVARFGEAKKRQPFLYPFGIAAFLGPTWFVLHMAREIFLR